MRHAKKLSGVALLAAVTIYAQLGGQHCTPEKVRWERCETWVIAWSTTRGRVLGWSGEDETGSYSGRARLRCVADADGTLRWTIIESTCRKALDGAGTG